MVRRGLELAVESADHQGVRCGIEPDSWRWAIDREGVFSVAVTRRIPRRAAIKRRGMDIQNVLCPLCGVEEENLMHLFRRCEVAARTWEALFKWSDIQVSNFRDPNELLKNVGELKLNGNKKRVIEAIVCTDMWFIRKYRNDVAHVSCRLLTNAPSDSVYKSNLIKPWHSTAILTQIPYDGTYSSLHLYRNYFLTIDVILSITVFIYYCLTSNFIKMAAFEKLKEKQC
ncbi:hypothetical protein LXL04_022824 [Taraxacum kok-saghyz]